VALPLLAVESFHVEYCSQNANCWKEHSIFEIFVL